MVVTFVNADRTIDLDGDGFTHVSLPNQARRGLQARTLGKAMQAWLISNPLEEAVAVVEWRIARWVVPELERQGISWTLMDRSPLPMQGCSADCSGEAGRRPGKQPYGPVRPASSFQRHIRPSLDKRQDSPTAPCFRRVSISAVQAASKTADDDHGVSRTTGPAPRGARLCHVGPKSTLGGS